MTKGFTAELSKADGRKVVYIQGSFSQTCQGQVFFMYDPSQVNNKSVPLNVGGCVSLNGNISLNLQTQPQQGTTNFQIISYNCSQQLNISSSQIQVIPNYNGSSCDTINSQAINQPNSLAVSITSTLGNKCKSVASFGLIVGLSVALPIVVIIIILGAIFYNNDNKKKKMKKFANDFQRNQLGGTENSLSVKDTEMDLK